MPRRSARLGAFAVGLACLAVALPALADNKDPTPEEIAAARELAKEGVRLARAGQCDAAIPKLERARELYEAPVIPAVALGDCLIKKGQIVHGTEVLQLVVRANLGPKAEKVNLAAKDQAKTLLDAALPRIAKLVIQVVAPPGIEVLVTVDKQPVPKSLVGIARPTDPGERTLEASGPGLVTQSRTVTLTDGQESSVTLTLALDASVPKVVPVAVPPPAPREEPSRVPAYVLLGVGGAGIVAGAVTGVLALTTKSTLTSECPADRCPPSASGDLSSLKTLSWVSTIGLGVGAAAAVGGVVLLFRTPARSDTRSDIRAAGVTVRATVGLGTFGVVGEF